MGQRRPGADPMANFARLLGDPWRQASRTGHHMIHTWHWGPGRRSVRRMTDGFGADGRPWREVQVFYAHPTRKQVRLLGLSPFAQGVSEGEITVADDGAEGVCDLHQAGRVHRKMGLRWSFDGPDRYRETLLEAGRGGTFEPLVTFDQVRIRPAAVPRPPAAAPPPPPSRLPKALRALQGAWKGPDSRSEVVWIPYADAVHVRTVASGAHRLDAYLYRHTGRGALRCLALTENGGVAEGGVTAGERGAVEIDLTDDRGRRRTVRFEVGADGAVRQRTWSGRTLLGDVRHRRRQG